MVDELRLIQVIKGRRIKPIVAPSGTRYEMPGWNQTLAAASSEDKEWLISLRMRGG